VLVRAQQHVRSSRLDFPEASIVRVEYRAVEAAEEVRQAGLPGSADKLVPAT
jgi:hypothetical protein